MQIDEKEISEFVKATIKGIKDGLAGEDFLMTEPIKFHLAVTQVKESGGGVKLYVVDAGGKYKAEEISKIDFEVQPIDKTSFGQMVYP